MGGRARSFLHWLRHRSRRVSSSSSSSFHLTFTTTDNNDSNATSEDLRARSLPHQFHAEEEEREVEEEEEEREVGEETATEGAEPASESEGCIVLGDPEPGAGPRAPVRTEPLLMDPSKKVGQLNSIPVIALLDPCDFPVPICF
jgi:hypothetical protein